MRERAELIGGTLEITQPTEGGTLVRLKIPQDKLQTHAA
jgi:signal transduction histidine kinase